MRPTILEKIPAMVYSGLLSGVILEIILPKTETINGTIRLTRFHPLRFRNLSSESSNAYHFVSGVLRSIGRRHFIFGGICIATWIAYYRER